MSTASEIRVTYTKSGLQRYMIEIRHAGLNKYQAIQGDDPDVVRQRAQATMAQWDDMWAKRLEREQSLEAKRLEREKKAQGVEAKRLEQKQRAESIEKKKQIAIKQTEEAQDALEELEYILVSGLAAVKNTSGYRIAIPGEPKHTRPPAKPNPPAKPKPPTKPSPPTYPSAPKPPPKPSPPTYPSAPKPLPKPSPPTYPPEPDRAQYDLQPDLLDRLLDSLAPSRKTKREQVIEARFEAIHQRWEAEKAVRDKQYKGQLQEYLIKLQTLEQQWEAEKAVRDKQYKGQLQEYLIKLQTLKQQWEAEKATRDKRYEDQLQEYQTKTQKLEQQWEADKRSRELEYQRRLQDYETTLKASATKHAKAVTQWKAVRTAYQKGDPVAVINYCDYVLSKSHYPNYFPKDHDLEYLPDNRVLLLDYDLPPLDKIPTLKGVRYVQTRDEFDESHISTTQLNRLYDDLLYQIVLRTVYEIFAADVGNIIDEVAFNGYVRSRDLATGKKVHACILSLMTKREEFIEIDLANVEPRACFKKLKGVGSSKLHSLTPVAPILQMNREDKRFVDAYGVVDRLREGDNLAVMDWEDFEHLVRELFEKEFSGPGSEVKVTRASRDGGIDAVVFDPDPLRGGKIVIQAKRYTNTVGVSAVRDLYGSLISEGANQGILVSTADYGPDAYEFAKDKPIKLLNGSNLLHLLERHGHKAYIDLKEAKKILADQDKP